MFNHSRECALGGGGGGVFKESIWRAVETAGEEQGMG